MKLRSLAPALLLMPALVACGGSEDDTTTLNVFAAASLTTTFTELGKEFEADHEGVKVAFNFAGSSDLVAQIQQGAPADVFASADEANMEKLPELSATNFASNTMEIAVPPGNPAGITSLQDLAGKDVDVVVCAAEVPCGAAAVKLADLAGITYHAVSEEQSVTDVLAKVSSGEADAGLVYVTDVTAADGSVDGVTFPESARVVNTYPIASLPDASDSDLAAEFVAFVLSEEGQQVLQEAGFGTP